MVNNILYFFQVSGWTMVGILICSVLALAVFLERLWTLRKGQVIPQGLPIETEDLVRRQMIPEAITLCKKSSAPLARIIQTGLEHAGKTRERIKEIVIEIGERESKRLGQYMTLLQTIITLAPMLGFLGTVIGMVELFSAVAEAGEVTNIGMIADGIYKALYTTLAGLTVAIPATIFYRYLHSRIDSLVMEMEEVSLRVVDLIQTE